VAFGFSPHLSWTVQTTTVLGDCLDHYRAQGLSRPLRVRLDLTEQVNKYTQNNSTSGIWFFAAPLMDCLDHYSARGLSRPLPCSRTIQTTTVLKDCSDHYRARGLFRPLACSGTILTTARRPLTSGTCDLYSHTVERHLFRPCYKAYTSPSSKLGDYIGTMHLPMHLVLLVRRLDS